MPTPNASRWRAAAVAILPPLALIGCGSVPPASKQPVAEPSSRTAIAEPSTSSSIPVLPRAGSGRGGYYQDDGPGDNPPEGLLDTPDAEPRIEPYRPANNRPY
ncbi:MAG TPA: septal ring lytic transglycosylase RlpA family protein, partial [Noviherbaspirillum sp.]